MSQPSPRVAIVMGSASDWPVMKKAADTLSRFEVAYEVRVLSAHRTPEAACAFARDAAERGLEVIISGAGLAAHLPGVLAAHTNLPVIGVPIASGALNGFDALLAIVQMPPGIPVATVGVGRADNAALLSLQILATGDAALRPRLVSDRSRMAERVAESERELLAGLE